MRAGVALRCGLPVDLRAVARESRGATLGEFSGSTSQGIALRRIRRDTGLKPSE
ncbi:MAG: hypothetical protein KDH17_09060 [Rhodocyclaceae bacterium]|nr:hypothetical protein [Rhodocyclaceae bacterium]